jgi:hypothetical protein
MTHRFVLQPPVTAKTRSALLLSGKMSAAVNFIQNEVGITDLIYSEILF